jgi:hypothetical protein
VKITHGDRELTDWIVSVWLRAAPDLCLGHLAAGAGVEMSDVWGAVRRAFQADVSRGRPRIQRDGAMRCTRCGLRYSFTSFVKTRKLCRRCRRRELEEGALWAGSSEERSAS